MSDPIFTELIRKVPPYGAVANALLAGRLTPTEPPRRRAPLPKPRPTLGEFIGNFRFGRMSQLNEHSEEL